MFKKKTEIPYQLVRDDQTPAEQVGTLKRESRSSLFPTVVALFSLNLVNRDSRVVIDSSLKKSLLAPDDGSASSESPTGCLFS